jgi:hypothetical protein
LDNIDWIKKGGTFMFEKMWLIANQGGSETSNSLIVSVFLRKERGVFMLEATKFKKSHQQKHIVGISSRGKMSLGEGTRITRG